MNSATPSIRVGSVICGIRVLEIRRDGVLAVLDSHPDNFPMPVSFEFMNILWDTRDN